MSAELKPTFRNWKYRVRQCLAILLSIQVFNVLVLPVAASARPDVTANPEQVRFEGAGGLILPGSVDSQTRNTVARCRDCSWKMTPACIPGPDNYCDALIRACPGLIDHVRTWFRPSGGDWIETGLVCLASSQIATVSLADQLIAQEFTRYIPDLVPRCWPETGVVTNLPYLCTSGQRSGIHQWSHELAGFGVNISATPRWVWAFSHTPLITAASGGPYPDTSVSHVFTRSGIHEFPITAVWHGAFTVDGLGPFEIQSDLRQGVQWQVSVGEARSKLMNETRPRG
jgi:hypothetical protein